MLRNNHAVQVDCRTLPEVEMAVQDFESNGGQLTYFSKFGEDSLCSNPRHGRILSHSGKWRLFTISGGITKFINY